MIGRQPNLVPIFEVQGYSPSGTRRIDGHLQCCALVSLAISHFVLAKLLIRIVDPATWFEFKFIRLPSFSLLTVNPPRDSTCGNALRITFFMIRPSTPPRPT